MEFGLLGPLLVDTGPARIEVSAPKQRIVLAALLLQANRVVTAQRLTELVWDGRPPAGARTALQNHVMRLRQALGSPVADRIRTSGPGYLIEVHPGELDLERFRVLQQDGCRAADEGRWAEARSLLNQALGQWRDDALLDVPSELLRGEAGDQLAELRARTLTVRIDADLELGGHEAAIAEIRRLIDQQPLNERPYGQLMLALYRSGRQADALAVYRELRHRLVEELGIEPCPDLRELHQRILSADAELPGRATVAEPSPGDAEPAPGPRRNRAASRTARLRTARLRTAVLPLLALLLGGVAGLQLLGLEPGPGPRLVSPDGRVRYIARTGSDEEGRATTEVELPVFSPVTAGDALIVSLTLTGTSPGAVTMTDTAGDAYTAVGDVTDAYGHRTLIFAAFHAQQLTTADRITADYPMASKYHIAADEFRGISSAGPRVGAASTATTPPPASAPPPSPAPPATCSSPPWPPTPAPLPSSPPTGRPSPPSSSPPTG